MVRQEFPEVRFRFFEGPRRPTYTRNRGSEMAAAPILFPTDDDSVMVSPTTVEKTLHDFDDPRIGAVAIPSIDVKRDQHIKQAAPPEGSGILVTEA